MKNKKIKSGKVIKGKDLKGLPLCKILSEDMAMQDFQYRIGMNEDINPLALRGSFGEGLSFSTAEHVCGYLNFGTKLAVVTVPDDEDVYVNGVDFRTHRLEVEEVLPLSKKEAWEYLVSNGADIKKGNGRAVRWAAQNGYLEIVKYLHENGADITADNDYAVRAAAEEGHLEVVKYLHENGADIAAGNNLAVISAAGNGHLKVVRYLYENGADLTADRNKAVIYAAEGGHYGIVKYLHENGADITADGNCAVGAAAEQGRLDIVKYLCENGADFTADENYALRHAALMGHLDAVKYLHGIGADIINSIVDHGRRSFQIQRISSIYVVEYSCEPLLAVQYGIGIILFTDGFFQTINGRHGIIGENAVYQQAAL